MILFVSYDLKSARDYTPFYEALKQQGSWWHYLASTWLISTDKSPTQVAEAVRPFMDSPDFLLVAEMGKLHQGYLPKSAWDWIEEHQKPVNAFLAPFGEYSSGANALTALAGLGSKPSEPKGGVFGTIAGGDTPKNTLLTDIFGGKTRSPWDKK